MDIHLDFAPGTKFPYPICNDSCEIHDTKKRTWRHLDFFRYGAYPFCHISTCADIRALRNVILFL